MRNRPKPPDNKRRLQHHFRHHDHPHPRAAPPAHPLATQEETHPRRRLLPRRLHCSLPLFTYTCPSLTFSRFSPPSSINTTASHNPLAQNGHSGTSANRPPPSSCPTSPSHGHSSDAYSASAPSAARPVDARVVPRDGPRRRKWSASIPRIMRIIYVMKGSAARTLCIRHDILQS